ncbi:hypothetical protein GALMADRAFT_205499 [Galerina marginata CBS 339.88]|uniref:Uncharacterized protein n=1 Tax=Galerina marginata (strain CBS 339.88) TaxID=685588 RepID=A0A067TX07_GALM3|nr:hypothetical protein GALMADRAFT_205499 [Galerina marginata CBS 339.88]
MSGIADFMIAYLEMALGYSSDSRCPRYNPISNVGSYLRMPNVLSFTFCLAHETTSHVAALDENAMALAVAVVMDEKKTQLDDSRVDMITQTKELEESLRVKGDWRRGGEWGGSRVKESNHTATRRRRDPNNLDFPKREQIAAIRRHLSNGPTSNCQIKHSMIEIAIGRFQQNF